MFLNCGYELICQIPYSQRLFLYFHEGITLQRKPTLALFADLLAFMIIFSKVYNLSQK